MGEISSDTNVLDGVYTNACKGYLDKLASIGAARSPGKLILSASGGGYANTNLSFDNVRYGTNYPWAGYAWAGSIMSNMMFSVETLGLTNLGIIYADGVEEQFLSPEPSHITDVTNIAGYLSWGSHSLLTNAYATDGQLVWHGNGGWYLIETFESFNGQPGAGQRDFFQWFSSYAFAGTNYSSTPIGAVTHVDEPDLSGVNDGGIYFGMWGLGKNFAICAWASRNTPFFQAVGDPFVKK